MKTNGTRILLITLLLYFFVVVLSFSAFTQPDYDFTNGSLVSGTDKLTGAKYRFTSVKPGVDALVTITAITGGISLNSVDGGSGFAEAFQPVIVVPALSSGYAEFKIDFVAAGTSNPLVMLEVPATCIDVDGIISGGKPVNEFDMVNTSAGYYVDYDQLGGELSIGYIPGWVTGTNIASIDYPGVDTMAKQAMFSVVSANISSMTIRVGANNQSTSSAQRLRSVYFKKFSYPNSFLARPALLSFRGTRQQNQVNLQWLLDKENNLSRIVVERSANGSDFEPVAEIWKADVSATGMANTYTDRNNLPESYYRLLLVSVNGEQVYSSVLSFRSALAGSNDFRVYPAAFQSTATVRLNADTRESAIFQLLDYSGKTVSQQRVNLEQGSNTIQLDGFSNLGTGHYVAVLKTSGKIYTQKVIKQ